MLVRLAVYLMIGCLAASDQAFAAKKKKKEKKEPPEVTQVLELPKDPPQAVVVEADRLVFFVSPLSAKGLLTQQIRDAMKALWSTAKGAKIVKIRGFVAGSGDMRRVPAVVSELFTEKRQAIPAVSVIQVGGLPLDGAQVVLEAMAVEKKSINPDGVVFLTGLKKPPQDARSITCFMNSFDKLSDLRAEFGTSKAALNFVQLRRDTLGDYYECEAIVAAAAGQGFNGKLMITGTQLAFGSKEEDIRLAFGRLEKALNPAKLSDSLAAGLYPLSASVAEAARKVRWEFFNEKKPPASTLLVFEGLPSLDALFGVEVVTRAAP